MESGKRPKIKTCSITAKCSVDEETLFRDTAAAAGLTVSEWARRSLLSTVRISGESRLLLNELMALRMVFLQTLVDGAPFTKQRLDSIVESAEKMKAASAEKRIQTFVSEPRAILPEPL